MSPGLLPRRLDAAALVTVALIGTALVSTVPGTAGCQRKFDRGPTCRDVRDLPRP